MIHSQSGKIGVHNNIPVTGRNTIELALCHGYPDIEGLTASLPPDATVIDVGAGTSRFGVSVAELRPDIKWTNIDPAYNNEKFLQWKAEAPPNVQFLPTDAQDLQELYGPESVDVAFSYWAVSHLMVLRPEHARRVVEQMFAVVKFGGRISIGPVKDKRLHRAATSTIIRIKDDTLTASGLIDEVATHLYRPR